MQSGATYQMRRRQRGATLIEALLAFVVLGIASVAAARLQSQLRLDADLARDRAQATRLAERDFERLRSYAVLDAGGGLHTYAAIAPDAGSTIDPMREASGAAGAVSFRIERRVEASAFAAGREIAVAVGWTDRQGSERSVTLHGFIARVDPAHAGALALGTGAIGSASRGYRGRNPSLFVAAKDLGDGRSLWKPQERGRVAFLLDNRSGDGIGRCTPGSERTTTELTAIDAIDCTATHRLFVSGTIRFMAAAGTLTAQPTASVQLALASQAADAAECTSQPMKTVRYRDGGSVHVDAVPAEASAPADAIWIDTGERYIAWQCAVAPGADGSWSGRADVAVPALGGDAGEPRVCRLSRDIDGNGRIDANIEHPASYSHVTASLPAQNFVVVAGSTACPAASVQHQP